MRKIPHRNFQDLMKFGLRTESNCIEWAGYLGTKGYGRMNVNGNEVKVHRYVATMFYGAPLEKQQAMHSCDNRSCFNPDHLSWGSNQDNVRDMHAKGRQYKVPTGDKHPNAIFTWDDVAEIRALRIQGMQLKQIAALKNCHPSTIGLIIRNQTWKVETNV